MKINTFARRASLACTVGVVIACGAAAVASAEEFEGDDVDVTVEIAEVEQPGVLALSVESGSTALIESGSTLTQRQFTGTLPTVTVTDTRDLSEIPEGAGWTVLGTASAFAGNAGQPEIPAGNLGWAPALVTGDEDGYVSAGLEVETVLDAPSQPGNNVGLVDQELLFATGDSAATSDGVWSANAELYLRTPSDVAAGTYTSTLTLSLFE